MTMYLPVLKVYGAMSSSWKPMLLNQATNRSNQMRAAFLRPHKLLSIRTQSFSFLIEWRGNFAVLRTPIVVLFLAGMPYQNEDVSSSISFEWICTSKISQLWNLIPVGRCLLDTPPLQYNKWVTVFYIWLPLCQVLAFYEAKILYVLPVYYRQAVSFSASKLVQSSHICL